MDCLLPGKTLQEGMHVEVEVSIARPPADVGRYMFDPRNDAEWTSGVVECRSLTDGPLR